MQVYGQGRPAWFQEGYYPIKDRMIQGADTTPESIFLVDLGCGSGHDASRLLQAMGSDVPGKVVLQDLPSVIEVAEKQAAPRACQDGPTISSRNSQSKVSRSQSNC